MAVGPISRTGISPIPESRSLIPVTPSSALPALPAPLTAPTPTGAVERKIPPRQKKKAAEKDAERIGERDRDTAAPETAPESTSQSAPGDRTPTGTARPAGTGSAGQARRDWSAPGSAPFVTQVLAQEVLKQGLYIEP